MHPQSPPPWLRILVASCAVVLMVTGLVDWSKPLGYNPIVPRMVLAALGAALAALPGFREVDPARYRDMLWGWGIACTAWFFWVAYVHELGVDDVLGLLLIVTLTATFSSRRLQVLVLLALIAGSLAATSMIATQFPASLAGALLCTTAGITGLLNVSNLELQQSLEQRVLERTHQLEQTNQQLRAEMEVRKVAEARAEAASQAKSRFLATMSHELRTPLNAIQGYTDLIADDIEDEAYEAIPDDLDKVRLASDRLLQLIDQLLDVTRIEQGTLDITHAEVPIGPLVQHALAGLDTDREFQVRVDDRLVARADPERLRQILDHLLNNAIKFAPDGPVEIETTATDDGIAIAVVDHGGGIAPEAQEVIFDRFAMVDGSTTRTQGGAGLGLSLARDLAVLMGGQLHVESDIGQGARFTVTVPAA